MSQFPLLSPFYPFKKKKIWLNFFGVGKIPRLFIPTPPPLPFWRLRLLFSNFQCCFVGAASFSAVIPLTQLSHVIVALPQRYCLTACSSWSRGPSDHLGGHVTLLYPLKFNTRAHIDSRTPLNEVLRSPWRESRHSLLFLYSDVQLTYLS